MKGDPSGSVRRIRYVQVNTAWERWYRASLRHDLRQLGVLGADETDDERAARLAGPPDARAE